LILATFENKFRQRNQPKNELEKLQFNLFEGFRNYSIHLVKSNFNQAKLQKNLSNLPLQKSFWLYGISIEDDRISSFLDFEELADISVFHWFCFFKSNEVDLQEKIRNLIIESICLHFKYLKLNPNSIEELLSHPNITYIVDHLKRNEIINFLDIVYLFGNHSINKILQL
jgi:hypothetical protein